MTDKKITVGWVLILMIVVGFVVGIGTYFVTPKESISGVPESVYDEAISELNDVKSTLENLITHGSESPLLTAMDVRTNPVLWVDTAKYMKDPPWTIGMTVPWMGCVWESLWNAEAKNAVEEDPRIEDIIMMDASGDLKREEANVRDMIAMGIDILIFKPVDPVGSVPLIEELYDAGIPIVMTEMQANTTKYTTLCIVDTWDFGVKQGTWLAEVLGGEGKVIGIQGDPVSSDTMLRTGGLMAVLDEYPGIEVIATEYGEWSYDKGKEVARDLIAANPDFDAFYANGGQMDLGCIDALIDAGYDVSKYPHATEDQNGVLLAALEYDIPVGIVSSPIWQARLVVEECSKILSGLSVRKNNVMPVPFWSTTEEIEKIARPNISDLSWGSTSLSDEELIELGLGRY